jgi:hypothetical protein
VLLLLVLVLVLLLLLLSRLTRATVRCCTGSCQLHLWCCWMGVQLAAVNMLALMSCKQQVGMVGAQQAPFRQALLYCN